jgi:uridine kinase
MIIHISGASGSGKTTLGDRLKKHKNFIVIDTDKIDDRNFFKLIKQKVKMSELFKLKDELNYNSISKCMAYAKKYNKDLIIVGMIFKGNADPNNYADKKYFISIDHDTLYRRRSLRTLDDIVKMLIK